MLVCYNPVQSGIHSSTVHNSFDRLVWLKKRQKSGSEPVASSKILSVFSMQAAWQWISFFLFIWISVCVSTYWVCIFYYRAAQPIPIQITLKTAVLNRKKDWSSIYFYFFLASARARSWKVWWKQLFLLTNIYAEALMCINFIGNKCIRYFLLKHKNVYVSFGFRNVGQCQHENDLTAAAQHKKNNDRRVF